MYWQLLPSMHGTDKCNAVALNLGLLLQERGMVTEWRECLDIAQDTDQHGPWCQQHLAQLSQHNRLPPA